MVRSGIGKHSACKQSIYITSFKEGTNKSEAVSKEDHEALNTVIAQQHFVTKVHVVAPCGEEVTSCDLLPEVTTVLTNTKSFIVRQLSLDALASYDFIQSFTKQGEVQCISEGRLLGCHDCAALYPSGRLSLVLSHHTYHALGLEGTPVTNILRRPLLRYAVHVNTLSPGFYPSRSGYERTLKCLRKLKMDFRVVWEPNSLSVCPSSIAKYFSDLGYSIEAFSLPTVDQSSLKEVEVPLVSWRGIACLKRQQLSLTDECDDTETNTTDEEHRQDALDFLDCVGCLLLEVKPVNAVRRSSQAKTVRTLHCEGFFSSVALQRVVATARSWLHSADSQCPWVYLSFHIHPETPFERRGCRGCAKTKGPHCGSVACGCRSVERDQHSPDGECFMVALTPSGDDCWFQGGTAGVRHRYYPKTSNNK